MNKHIKLHRLTKKKNGYYDWIVNVDLIKSVNWSRYGTVVILIDDPEVYHVVEDTDEIFEMIKDDLSEESKQCIRERLNEIDTEREKQLNPNPFIRPTRRRKQKTN